MIPRIGRNEVEGVEYLEEELRASYETRHSETRIGCKVGFWLRQLKILALSALSAFILVEEEFGWESSTKFIG